MPVGPEFEDPPPTVNQKPYFVSANHFPFTVQSFPPGGLLFSVQVADPNVNDVLEGKWIANYPDYQNQVTTKEITLATRSVNMDLSTQFELTTTCKDFPAAAANSLAFIVSDRGFLAFDDAYKFDPSHPYNFDDEQPPQRILTMIYWPIIGCQQ